MGVGMGWEAAKSHIPGISPDLPRASVLKPGLPEHVCLKPSGLWEKVYNFCLFVLWLLLLALPQDRSWQVLRGPDIVIRVQIGVTSSKATLYHL